MELFPYNLVLLLPLVFLPLYFLVKFSHQNKHSTPPGPPKLPIIGNLHQLGKPPRHILHKLSQKYGPVMLLQLGSVPTVVITSAEAAEQVLKTYDLDFCTRPPFAGPKRLTYNYLDIAFGPYCEYLIEMRKLCFLHLLSMKRVQSFAVIREEELSLMIDSISNFTDPIDLFKMLISLTDEILSRIAFGKTFQSRDELSDGRLQEILYETMPDPVLNGFSASDFFPSVGWIFNRITGVYGRIEKSFHDFDEFFQQIIDLHLSLERNKSEHKDLIDVLLKIKDGSSTVRLTNDHIKAVLLDAFLAGVDTSAVTMNWAMVELARNPDAMKKVQGEIRNYVGTAKGKVEESELGQFLYLKMVVKETLRLHPPGPLLLPRECTKHHVISGYDVYPNTRILINAWAIGRNPEYWDKPDQFIPERFEDFSIDFTGGQYSDPTDKILISYLSLGGGRRSCPGMNMAPISMELILANLLYCFNWELPKA
ncbi:cytochrome P450 71B35-like [Papaver somniferum]|uniref:cytochrome P450 71B35-like n=1 Tax=Papaver somniferum TaxID=3469 RepID=UPI000E6F96ED|nr:cytochrome P450 71B35-like [Papaver somniferum]